MWFVCACVCMRVIYIYIFYTYFRSMISCYSDQILPVTCPAQNFIARKKNANNEDWTHVFETVHIIRKLNNNNNLMAKRPTVTHRLRSSVCMIHHFLDSFCAQILITAIQSFDFFKQIPTNIFQMLTFYHCSDNQMLDFNKLRKIVFAFTLKSMQTSPPIGLARAQAHWFKMTHVQHI